MRDLCNEFILENKTSEFMKQYKYQTFFKLTQDQIDILREKSTDVAYKLLSEHDYLVATKLKDMTELKRFMLHRGATQPLMGQMQPLMKRRGTQR